MEMIVSNIAGRVEADELKQHSDSRPENMTAYDHVLKGLEHHRRSGVTCEEAEKALENLKKQLKSILTMQGHMPGEHAHFPVM